MYRNFSNFIVIASLFKFWTLERQLYCSQNYGKNSQSNQSVRRLVESHQGVSCTRQGVPDSICANLVTKIWLLRILGNLLLRSQAYKRAHGSIFTDRINLESVVLRALEYLRGKQPCCYPEFPACLSKFFHLK